MVVRAPDGSVYDTASMSQGRFLRLENPAPGDWFVSIVARTGAPSPFLARAYVRNPSNHVDVGIRYPSVVPTGEIYVYAYPTNMGLALTSDKPITANVIRPDGSTDTLMLYDRGRDASGHGDDVPGDGVFTGVYHSTGLAGPYQFQVKADIEDWVVSGDAHEHKNAGPSTRFSREAWISTAVKDPHAVETTAEDDRPTPVMAGGNGDGQTARLLRIIALLLLLAIVMLWLCCCRKRWHE